MSILKWILRLLRSWWTWLVTLLFPRTGGGGTIPDDHCCSLARTDNECQWAGSKADYTCPQGFHRTWWYCCEGTQQIGCGECSGDAYTCWSGPWECSIWWWTGQSC
jgi:hypothetical protein